MVKALYVNEILAKIDKAEGEEKEKLLVDYGSKHPINMILSLNFNDKIEINVPSGMPPYKRDESLDPDMLQTTLTQQIKRVASILKGRSESISNMKREAVFIQILEGISTKEADVLIFAKDGALEELYPTITYDLVQKHFPSYCNRLNKDGE